VGGFSLYWFFLVALQKGTAFHREQETGLHATWILGPETQHLRLDLSAISGRVIVRLACQSQGHSVLVETDLNFSSSQVDLIALLLHRYSGVQMKAPFCLGNIVSGQNLVADFPFLTGTHVANRSTMDEPTSGVSESVVLACKTRFLCRHLEVYAPYFNACHTAKRVTLGGDDRFALL